jgi:hypothetical protein
MVLTPGTNIGARVTANPFQAPNKENSQVTPGASNVPATLQVTLSPTNIEMKLKALKFN